MEDGGSAVAMQARVTAPQELHAPYPIKFVIIVNPKIRFFVGFFERVKLMTTSRGGHVSISPPLGPGTAVSQWTGGS